VKSEEELDAQIEQINAGDPERAAKLTLLDERGLLGFREASLLDIVRGRIRNMEEAEARSGEPGGRMLGSRARRNTKNNFIDAIHKLDKQIDKTIEKHGLQGEVETFRRGLGAAE